MTKVPIDYAKSYSCTNPQNKEGNMSKSYWWETKAALQLTNNKVWMGAAKASFSSFTTYLQPRVPKTIAQGSSLTMRSRWDLWPPWEFSRALQKNLFRPPEQKTSKTKMHSISPSRQVQKSIPSLPSPLSKACRRRIPKSNSIPPCPNLWRESCLYKKDFTTIRWAAWGGTKKF